MTIVLLIVLIALAFGFVFAKLDSFSKICRKLQEDIIQLQQDVKKDENKNNN